MSETARLTELYQELKALEEKIAIARRQLSQGPVADYRLAGRDGPVRLSELFGKRDRLIVVHNMGFACPYCTMWADGFNGLLPHIETQSAFVLANPDEVGEQAAGAAKRGWNFAMVSTRDSSFAKDMGFEAEDGSPTPGTSTLVRADDGTIRRYDAAPFGPGDKFCPVWSFADLLPPAES